MCSLVMRSPYLYDIPSSFLQHHISKADIALLSAFLVACVSHPESAIEKKKKKKKKRLYDTYLCCSGDVSIFPDI